MRLRAALAFLTLIVGLLVAAAVGGESSRAGSKSCPLTKGGIAYSGVEYEESEDSSGRRERVVICRYGEKVEERSDPISCGKAPMRMTAAIMSKAILVTVWCEK